MPCARGRSPTLDPARVDPPATARHPKGVGHPALTHRWVRREAGMRAPERIETPGLILRRPRIEDAEGIFARYASDVDVTRFLSWPRPG